VDVRCERAVRRIEIVRDGELVHAVEDEPSLRWADEDCPAGQHWYYAHVLFEGEELNPYWNIAGAQGVHAWTSPVWVHRG